MINVQTEGALIRMEVDALATLESMQAYLDAMESILLEHETFGLMFLSDMENDEIKTQKRTKEASKLSNAWLKENRERIGKQCIGIAMVVKPTMMMRAMKPMASKTMKKMMGAQGDMFFERDQAETWMKSQLSQKGLV